MKNYLGLTLFGGVRIDGLPIRVVIHDGEVIITHSLTNRLYFSNMTNAFRFCQNVALPNIDEDKKARAVVDKIRQIVAKAETRQDVFDVEVEPGPLVGNVPDL